MGTIKTPIQMLQQWEQRFPDQIYLRQSTGSEWLEFSWQAVADKVRRLASWINQRAYPEGSRIAIWAVNSADWVITDLAIMLSGHISVPVYPAQDIKTASYILEHSEVKLLFVGGFERAESFDLFSHLDTVAMSGATVACDAVLADIIAAVEPKAAFAERSLDDVYSIIYSSGTSGPPKGVMLTFRAVSQTLPMLTDWSGRQLCEQPGDKRERLLSYLPMSHGAERSLLVIASLYLNSQVSISAGPDHFAREMQDVKPTFFGAVPRIWHKFMQGIEAALKAQGRSLQTEQEQAMVRQMLGLDNANNVVTGTAPASPALHQWFANIGLPLHECYGSTETFAYATRWNLNEPPVSGCVGRPVTGVQIKLADNNEILVQSPVLMSGYYKDPQKTSAVLQNGWYATGDTGRIDERGCLWLTGRTSSIFKTSKGKFINPERLENELQQYINVDYIMVFGHGLAQPLAVVNIAESAAGRTQAEVQAYFERTLAEVNASLPAYEKINTMLVVRSAWTIDGGELTPTLKIKRQVLAEKYAGKFGEHKGVVFDSQVCAAAT